MQVHLVDGTYELFRHFYALPSHRTRQGREVAATRGVLGSLLALLEEGATHLGVATDRVIESFRNELYPGYKTGEGIDPELRDQFELLERAVEAAGIALFAMVEYEADDALAAAAARAAADRRVEKVWICTPDKDLAQCVARQRVIQFDRRKLQSQFDADARAREVRRAHQSRSRTTSRWSATAPTAFPASPAGVRSPTATVLSHYVPSRPRSPSGTRRLGASKVRGARPARVGTLAEGRELALLFRRLARLAVEGPEVGAPDDWEWRGPRSDFSELLDQIDASNLLRRAERLAEARAG